MAVTGQGKTRIKIMVALMVLLTPKITVQAVLPYNLGSSPSPNSISPTSFDGTIKIPNVPKKAEVKHNTCVLECIVNDCF